MSAGDGQVLRTEYEFELPVGYLDDEGALHRTGVMRLATAADEILPMKDPRVQRLPAYLIVILLSRVVRRIGSVTDVNPAVIEGLFSSDLTYLQDLYNRINGLAPSAAHAEAPPGGSTATPCTGSTGRWPNSHSGSTGPTTN